VYRAEAHGLGGLKHVVIKRVLPELGSQAAFVERWLAGARVGARLDHSSCVRVLDAGRSRDTLTGDLRYFLISEYVDGASISALVRAANEVHAPFPAALAVYLAAEVCRALSYAHELPQEEGGPVAHGSLSSATVFVTRHGDVKLAGFGIPRAAEETSPPTAAADLRAAGALLWELLSGEPPLDYADGVLTPSLRDRHPGVDAELDALVRTALGGRASSAKELTRGLLNWLASGRHPIGALDLADRVGAHLGVAASTRPDALSEHTLEEVRAELRAFRSLLEIPTGAVATALEDMPSIEATIALLSEPSLPPALELEKERLHRAQVGLAAAAAALVVFVIMLLAHYLSR
jgi:serine/threonine protein kinase